jgi:GTPase SAR1 family protein
MTEDYTDGGNSIMMIRHKVVFVGDVCVGKTSVMCRFIENKFKDTYDVYFFL